MRVGLFLQSVSTKAMSSYSSLRVIFFTLVVSGFSQYVFASAPLPLQYTLKKGDSYRYTMYTSLRQSIGDMEMNTSMDAENDIILGVRAVSSGKSIIDVSYSKLKIAVAGLSTAGIPDTNMEMNIGNNVTESIELASDGAVRHLSVAKSLPKQEQALDRSAMLEQLSKQAFRYLLPPLPKVPAVIGDKWTHEQRDTTNGMIISSKWTYTFTAEKDTLGRRCAFIVCKSNAMTLEGTMNQMGVSFTMDGDGAGAGTMLAELSSGMAINGKVTTQFDVRLAMTGQENMIVPVTMETVNSFSRKIQ